MPKKTEREDPLGFYNIHSVAKYQKNHNAERTEKWNPIVSVGIVCYAEKEQHLYFSCLGQMVQFDILKFR